MKTMSVNSSLKFNNYFKSKAESNVVTELEVERPKTNSESESMIKTGMIVTSALAIAALTVSAAAIGKSSNVTKPVADSKNEIINELKEKLASLEQKLEKNTLSEETAGIKNSIAELKKELENKVKWYDGYIGGLDAKVKAIEGKISTLSVAHNPGERYMLPVDGLILAQNFRNDGKLVPVSEKMQEYLGSVAKNIMTGNTPTKTLGKDSSVWLISSETKWRGTGGQGEIFTQQGKNFKKVGVNAYEILAGNEVAGLGGISGVEGEYVINYEKESIPIEKVLSFPVECFRNGKYEMQPVTVYKGIDPKTEQPLLLFENSMYFRAKGTIYNDSQGVSEKERFAFYGTAAYELAKLLKDPKSVPNVEIFSKNAFDSIKAPDAVHINDWSAAAIAVASKLRAPLEAENGELSAKAAKELSEMTIVIKDHNLDYQGEAWGQAASDIINTVCGKYASDIYKYAKTGYSGENMEGISHVLTIDGNVNMANWGLCLANKAKNVSNGDLTERMKQSNRGRGLQHGLIVRNKHKTIIGKGNPWDRSANEVSAANLPMLNKMLNEDILLILTKEVEKISEQLTGKDKVNALEAISDLTIDNYAAAIEKLKALKNPHVESILEKLDNYGLLKLRTMTAYTHNDSIDVIMQNRRLNKEQFLKKIEMMVKYSRENSDIFGLHIPAEFNIENISNPDDVIVASFGARLVEQKNLPLLKQAIIDINSEWASKYPNKPHPVFVIGGPDDSKFFHDMMSEDLGGNYIFRKSRTPNPLYQAGSDYTLRTSEFEPDGDLAESLYKGTPTITTRVGGYVDRINGTGKGFLSKRTPLEVENAKEDKLKGMVEDYKNAFFDAADTYYNKKSAYEDMVRKDIDSNYSWIIRNEEGKITRDCGIADELLDLGFNLDEFAEFATA